MVDLCTLLASNMCQSDNIAIEPIPNQLSQESSASSRTTIFVR
jgi:hypothetical protein